MRNKKGKIRLEEKQPEWSKRSKISYLCSMIKKWNKGPGGR